MSSFICGQKHFNSIRRNAVDIISDEKFNDAHLKSVNLYDLSKRELKKEVELIVETLIFLNVVCWHIQYDEQKTTLEMLEYYKKQEIKKVKKLSPLGLYNALTCLGYQIEINHLESLRALEEEEKRAMMFIPAMKSALANHIVNALPDDETNAWSIE